MFERWLVAIVGLPLLLAVLLLCPPWATMLLVCAIAGIVAYELLHVAGKSDSRRVYVSTIVCAALQVYVVYACALGRVYATELSPMNGSISADELFLFPLLLTILLFLHAVMTYGKPGAVSFYTVAVALVGGVVFPMMYSCIVLLRLHPVHGKLFVLVPFVIAFAGDSLAMYFGKWFGNRKLTPVSPKKTWAGFYGSILGSVVGMAIFGFVGGRWFGYVPHWGNLLLLGVLGNLMGQLGDLATSLIKREVGVKDYSHLFLTHGGMLDRFDSTLFIAPVVYYYLSTGMI